MKLRPIIPLMTLLLSLMFSGILIFEGCNNVSILEESGEDAIGSVQEAEPAVFRLSFSAAGDNLIHDVIYQQARRRAEEQEGREYDFSYVYKKLVPFLKNFDVNWINQETLINDEFEPSSFPLFSSPGDLGKDLYAAGWRVFSLSNNHVYDKGDRGISAALSFWKTMPRDTVCIGLYTNDSSEPAILIQEIQGIKIAYVSYTESSGGTGISPDAEARVIYTWQRDLMEKQLRKARESADAVIAGIHWGIEYSHTPTKAQRDLARDLSAWGADLIIGTHPHVIQPIEWIVQEDGRESLVAYSLGNLVSAQDTLPAMIGIFLTFDLEQRADAGEKRNQLRIRNVKVYPVITHFESYYQNVRLYLFRDYSDQLAKAHGLNQNGEFTMKYIRALLEQHINPAFLVLE